MTTSTSRIPAEMADSLAEAKALAESLAAADFRKGGRDREIADHPVLGPLYREAFERLIRRGQRWFEREFSVHPD